ncbi:MAG: hypothetical protein WC310_01510 [Patescibacteria group bacterium]|jgi:hypothetical protein
MTTKVLHLVILENDEEEKFVFSLPALDLENYLKKIIPDELLERFQFLGRVAPQGDTGCRIEVINKKGGNLVFLSQIPSAKWIKSSFTAMPSSMVVVDKNRSRTFRLGARYAKIKCYVFKKTKEGAVPIETIYALAPTEEILIKTNKAAE